MLDPSLVPAAGDAGKEEDYTRVDSKKSPLTPIKELAVTKEESGVVETV